MTIRPSRAPHPRVLLGESDEWLRLFLLETLRNDGYDVIAVDDGATLKGWVEASVAFDAPRPRVHAIVTDEWLPHSSGIDVLDLIEALAVRVPVVVVSAGEPLARSRAFECGAFAVLVEPVERGMLLDAVRSAIAASR